MLSNINIVLSGTPLLSHWGRQLQRWATGVLSPASHPIITHHICTSSPLPYKLTTSDSRGYQNVVFLPARLLDYSLAWTVLLPVPRVYFSHRHRCVFCSLLVSDFFFFCDFWTVFFPSSWAPFIFPSYPIKPFCCTCCCLRLGPLFKTITISDWRVNVTTWKCMSPSGDIL